MSSDSASPFSKRNSITPSTWVAVRLGTIATILGGVVYAHGTWRDYMEENREALREIRTELRSIRSEQQSAWRLDNMERWAGRTRWENRDKGVSIPEPREFWSP